MYNFTFIQTDSNAQIHVSDAPYVIYIIQGYLRDLSNIGPLTMQYHIMQLYGAACKIRLVRLLPTIDV